MESPPHWCAPWHHLTKVINRVFNRVGCRVKGTIVDRQRAGGRKFQIGQIAGPVCFRSPLQLPAHLRKVAKTGISQFRPHHKPNYPAVYVFAVFVAVACPRIGNDKRTIKWHQATPQNG